MTQSKRPAPPPPNGIQDPRQLPYSPGRSRGRLPHLEKRGCTYFVTFCLADSAVAHAERRRRLENRSSALDVARFSEPAARPSDAVMSDPSLAAIVEVALLHFQGERIALHAWVVMPDHVHVVVTPLTHTLAEVIQSWKSFTAHQINRALGQSGRVWQSESFDHIVRSNDDYDRFVGYVDRNPVEAGLCAVPAEWPFSSARFRGE